MWVGSFVAPSTEMVQMLYEVGVKTFSLGDHGYIKPAKKLIAAITKYGIDVVVCASFKSYLAAKMATVVTKCRVIFWIPGIPLVISGIIRKLVFQVLARRDTLVFISDAVKTAHNYPGHKGKSFVIYYGVEDPWTTEALKPYPSDCRLKIGISSDAFVIAYIAEFISWKDHSTLLKAFAYLVDRYYTLHLVLIGTGQLYGQVKLRVMNMPYSERVHFLDSRIDARRILGIVDVYVHPSRGEGFGLAVVEAMLVGVPVVVSDEGALPEIVCEGETGRVFKGGDEKQLAKIIEELLNDKRQCEELGRKGRDYWLKKFAPDRFADELTQVL
jgi:glycosyltransferase involved in cell wall biosynthesis